ncbi:hypothetical protein L1887_36482 [Cichorium endivia]|nr:hypothetical protein L1887_36482 [Cichorium endivia]
MELIFLSPRLHDRNWRRPKRLSGLLLNKAKSPCVLLPMINKRPITFSFLSIILLLFIHHDHLQFTTFLSLPPIFHHHHHHRSTIQSHRKLPSRLRFFLQ